VTVNGETIINNRENLVPYMGSAHISPNKINNLNHNILENEMKDINNYKLIVVGDSHLRRSAIRIGAYLGNKFKVCGMIKPGASIVDMVIKSGMNYMCLIKKDVIVFLGGSNDVYRNNSVTALMQVVKFCEVVNNTNIIVLDIPHRYDLENNSTVNKEIQTFNRKLRMITKHFNHVSILEVSFNREAFTQYGLHLNRLGKSLITKQIAKKIYGFMEEKADNIIRLEWGLVTKENLENENPAPLAMDKLDDQLQNHPINSKQSYMVQEDIQVPRSSSRLKKLPVTRK
jgi:hypothetical protein